MAYPHLCILDSGKRRALVLNGQVVAHDGQVRSTSDLDSISESLARSLDIDVLRIAIEAPHDIEHDADWPAVVQALGGKGDVSLEPSVIPFPVAASEEVQTRIVVDVVSWPSEDGVTDAFELIQAQFDAVGIQAYLAQNPLWLISGDHPGAQSSANNTGLAVPDGQYANHYLCGCGEQWSSVASIMEDHPCPSCGTSCAPVISDDGSLLEQDVAAALNEAHGRRGTGV